MSERKTSRRKANRVLATACLIVIPALAIVALGTGLSLVAAGPAAPGGLLMAETRDLAGQGDAVTAVAKPADVGSIDQFMDTWQNTVRIPPSPRR